jgi:glutamyl-tRNA synthetase
LVVTRFAPSPTGFLHIGGARTALFNWLFARHHGGKFLLRIEDTDRKRSTQEAIDAIFEGMRWLDLDADEEPLFQSTRAQRHADCARELLDQGKAYHCYCTPEELTEMREKARAEGHRMFYDGMWRDRPKSDAPDGIPPVIRFKAPHDGETVIIDSVQGEVRVDNDQLDDMILLRADGTPTYMLSVVVDDHDMGITHVIRGDDHLTNAFRQTQLFLSLGWTPPVFGHIPLIHGADGAKLSKRHGALGVEAYRDMGFLPETVFNYLLRLGWGHGDDEIIDRRQAVEWFDLPGVGRAPARFDMDRLTSLNAHYIRNADDQRLVELISPLLGERLGSAPGEAAISRVAAGMSALKERGKTLDQLADSALFYAKSRPLELDGKATKLLKDPAQSILQRMIPILQSVTPWEAQNIEAAVRGFAESEDLKLGNVAQPLRAAFTGTNVSPGIFDVAEVLGRDEALGRIEDVTNA